ncbi:nicotinamide/nicotinic acid mononucleotide adenylyltransferase [Plakobranchus ocellatus]|uniref:Nicotinamide-nucleotide adenylyltransferase n=1 Tax=Plakobranchus ocellatus TaxID=259542 RepID=A0AAV3XXW3_9GAST|nr:nicotinamide/nicotinic acid mononucleotide adenylyltransferase [Plakobranchus ocellatus]
MFCWKSQTMATPSRVVLLACGSYNPVTNMHLRMFEIARDALNKTGRYQVVSGIMSPVSDGYKKKDLLPAKHRCEMLKLALKSSDWIKMDQWECSMSSWTQTAQVLRHHRQQVEQQQQHGEMFNHVKPSPKRRKKQHHNIVADLTENQIPSLEDTSEHSVPSVKLLCGADLLESFAVPGLWDEEDIEYIVGSHGLVVITRCGSDPQKFIYESDILTKYQENIVIVTEWIFNDISSTKVRRALRRGESVKYLVQDSVIDYIRKHQLYGVPDNKYFNNMLPSPNQENTTNQLDKESVGFKGGGKIVSEATLEDITTNPTSGEISVILRSAHNNGSADGFITRHLPLHRMITHLDKKGSPSSSLNGSPHRMEKKGSPASTVKVTTTFTKDDEPQSNHKISCISDIGTLVRRVKNVRVGFTPETRV